MASLNDVYKALHRELEKVIQTDRAEKDKLRLDAAANRAAASTRLSQLDQEISTLAPYKYAAAAYIPVSCTQTSYPPARANLDYLASLYSSASTGTGDWIAIYRCASAGIAWLENEKRRLQAAPAHTPEVRSSSAADAQCRRILQSKEAAELKSMLAAVDDYYAPMKLVQRGYSIPTRSTLPPFGKVGEPFPVTDGCVTLAKQIFGDGFDQSNRTLLRHSTLPHVTLIQAHTGLMGNVMRYMRMYAFSFICNTLPAQQKVFFLDACTLDPSCLGFLKCLTTQGDSIIASVPESMADVQSRLSELRQLQTASSAHRLLILRYRAASSDHGFAEKLQWLCANAANYHLQVVMIQELPDSEADFAKFRPHYLPADARTFVSPSHQYLETAVEHRRLFWYLEPDSIPQAFINALVKAHQPAALETRYFKVNPIPQSLPYTRDRKKKLSLLYGVGAGGRKYYLDLDDVDFSAYIVGATRSGKSTLLNTLITSAILNHHPDDLEMWLVDFGRTEFHRYTKHRPPHVRYVLIEKTTELVCSLLQKLREEIDRRGRILTKYSVHKITELPEGLPKEDHMPKLLVIIDEFGAFKSILADPAFPDKQVFKGHLEYLLLQGAKHGMHFIFSNQYYVDVASVLSDDAKNQIGLRVSMLADKNEMRSSLGLSSSQMTKAESDRINSLPKHQALFTCRSNPGVLSEPVHVLYFDEEGEQTQLGLIDSINRTLKPTAQSRRDPSNTYAAHLQFCLDRDAIPQFRDLTAAIQADIRRWQQNPAWQASDKLLYLGEPRNMNPVHHELLRSARDNNMVIFGSYARNLTGLASLLFSIDQSARMQGLPVEYWCDERDLLANRFIKNWAAPGSMILDRTKLCARAEALDQQWDSRTLKPRLIIVTGFSDILSALEDDKAENARRSRSGGGKAEELSLDAIRSMVGNMSLLQAPTAAAASSATYDLQGNINDLLNLFPKYGVHFVFVVQGEGELLASRLDLNHFTHQVGFASGVVDCTPSPFRRRVIDISEPEMCGCLANGQFTVYMPFSDLK